MKKTIFITFSLIFTFSLFSTNNSKAQFVNDGVYIKDNAKGRVPIPYPSLREADVMWSRRVWRILDLRQKINHPFYYPTQPIGGRMSLFDLILWGIKNEGLQAYSKDDDEFKIPIGLDQINVEFDAGLDTVEIKNYETGEITKKVIEKEIKSDEVKQYLIKEEWFFDRKYSTMNVRIIGICPIRVYEKTDPNGDVSTIKSQTFWVYFPDARRIFANHEAYNPKNDAQRLTYDDMFFQRRFSSYIYSLSNVYNNRLITQYAIGMQAMFEAEDLKQYLFETEHDLWEY